MSEMQHFDKPKPPVFPPVVDVRTRKALNFLGESDLPREFSESMDSVLKVLDQNDTEVGLEKRQLAKKIADSISGRNIVSGLYDAFSVLPPEILAKAELAGSVNTSGKNKEARSNFEDPDATNAILKQVESQLGFDTPEVRAIQEDIFGSDTYFTSVKSLPGQAITAPHNLTLLHGIGSNPVKKGDNKNYNKLLTDSLYSDIYESSLTPRNILKSLDPNFFTSIDQSIQGIVQQAAHLNIKDVKDPFTNDGIESFDINANYYSLLASQTWKNWTPEQAFAFVNRAWETTNRFGNVLRQILGRSVDLPKTTAEIDKEAAGMIADPDDKDVVGTIVDSDAVSDIKAELETQNTEKSDAMLERVKEWWEKIGNRLDPSQLLPYGLLSALAPHVTNLLDWGNWGQANAETSNVVETESGFRDIMIGGALDHTGGMVFDRFKSHEPLKTVDFAYNSVDEAKQIYASLRDSGFLDAEGHVTDAFNARDPEFDLKLPVDDLTAEQVRSTLRNASIGQFSFEVQDVRKNRRNVQLLGADGQYRSLLDIVDLINNGADPLEKITNARTAYEYFYAIHQSMTGVSAQSEPSKGTVNYRQLARDVFEVDVYPEGTWDEKMDAGLSAGDAAQWQSVSSQKVTLQFSSAEEATAFKDNIRVLMALLEPVVGTFAPDQTEVEGKPISFLVDNSGSATNPGVLDPNHPNYGIQVDQRYSKTFFASESWTQISKFLEKKVGQKVFTEVFSKMTLNKTLSLEHQKKWEEYNDEKENHEETERQRMESENRRQAEEAEQEAKAEAERKARREAELKAQREKEK